MTIDIEALKGRTAMTRAADVVRLSGDEYDRLMDELEILRQEATRAWLEVDFISKERTEHLEWRTKLANDLDECERMRDTLRAENERLREGVSAAQEELRLCQQDAINLQDENERLREEIASQKHCYALLEEERQRLHDENERMHKQIDQLTGQVALLDAKRDELRSDNERLRKDAEFFDWAESHPELAMRQLSSDWAICGSGFREKYFKFRGAIAAAMERKNFDYTQDPCNRPENIR